MELSIKNTEKILKTVNELREQIDNGSYKGMCISVKGLEANGYIDDSYKSYDGYIVIEYNDGEKFYSVWLTNKEFTIDGYEEGKLDKLSYGKGLFKR